MLAALFAWPAIAAAEEPRVYLFWGASCPYSNAAHAFLKKQSEHAPGLQVVELETEGSALHRTLLGKLYRKIGLGGVTIVPTIVVGGTIHIGYIDDETTGEEIMESVAACRKERCADIMAPIIQQLHQPDEAAFTAEKPSVCRMGAQVITYP